MVTASFNEINERYTLAESRAIAVTTNKLLNSFFLNHRQAVKDSLFVTDKMLLVFLHLNLFKD